MASKDRIQRLKDETRCNILVAALDIVKEEGWQAMSMRKIADKIEYTAPIIYEYFANKDAILTELTRKGYCILTQKLTEAKSQHEQPEQQLEAMWLAYWNFAFEEKQLYQLMFGVEMNCCVFQNTCPDLQAPANMIREVIANILDTDEPSEEWIARKYYTFWSVVHGLISINLVRNETSDELNKQVLKDAIGGIINSISVTA